jgi:hypothetical protein
LFGKREGKGREGKGREGKGREGKGREGKGREGNMSKTQAQTGRGFNTKLIVEIQCGSVQAG